MTLRNLLQRREAIRVEMRNLLDAHPADMPDDQSARFAALQTEADGLVAT